MAKKRAKTSPSNASPGGSTRARLIKLMVTDEQLQDLRVAAAIQDCRVGEFCRDAALEVASKMIRQKYSSKQ